MYSSSRCLETRYIVSTCRSLMSGAFLFAWGRLCSSNQAHCVLPWNFLVLSFWHLEDLRRAGGFALSVRWRTFLHLALAIALVCIRVTWLDLALGHRAFGSQHWSVSWSLFWLGLDLLLLWHSRSPSPKKRGNRNWQFQSRASQRESLILKGLFRSLIEVYHGI